MNRRQLILASPALLVVPRLAYATIPPPPSSPWYLLFIADGIYKISGLYIVNLPASVGNCRAYNKAVVSQAVGANFTFTNRTSINAWNMLSGAPLYKWWEVYDKRVDRYVKIYEGDRFEVRFADKSRVKVMFNGPFAPTRFEAVVGTERLPDGTRLYPPDRRGTLGGDGKGRDGDNDVTPVKPSTTTFSWSWSTQETPW